MENSDYQSDVCTIYRTCNLRSAVELSTPVSEGEAMMGGLARAREGAAPVQLLTLVAVLPLFQAHPRS